MIYLSAQPDDYYFLWQLQLQVFNFRSLGIKPRQIHILIGFNPLKGLNPEFYQWITGNEDAMFFTYADERKSPLYLSSIRPHIITRHIEALPHLTKETLFYHDSDIVFRRLPDFHMLAEGESWYTSDTRAYLDTNYIVNIAGELLLKQMCDIVGIPVNIVKAQDHNAGGAQYLIKNCPLSFWKKLEGDSEKLYRLMEDYNNNLCINAAENPRFIQAWCADMWAFWWNALLHNKAFEIHPELDFVWADSTIAQWHAKNILHYTGDISKKKASVFRKADFAYYDPFYTLFSQLDEDNASHALKNLIDRYRGVAEKQRVNLLDVTFLFFVHSPSEEHLENLYICVNYLTKWFKTKICVIEWSETQQVDHAQFVEKPQYSFAGDRTGKAQLPLYINDYIQELQTPIISFYEIGVVLPICQFELAVNKIRQQEASVVFIQGASAMRVDRLSKAIFSQTLDPSFFEKNQGKYNMASEDDSLGLMITNRRYYLDRVSTADLVALIDIIGFTPDNRFETISVIDHMYCFPGSANKDAFNRNKIINHAKGY